MIFQTKLEKIKKIAEEFFEKMTFEIKIDSISQTKETVSINLKTSDPQILIGERGQTLIDIQKILKAILKRKIEEPFFIDLDIEDYKKKKIRALKELAKSTADEVVLTKKEKILAPMSAYERRIIHLELAERADVTSASIGQEPERRVVIRPYP